MGPEDIEKFANLLKGYADERNALLASIETLANLSVREAGRESRHGREFWATVLLAKLSITSMSLKKLLPEYASKECGDLWDLTSVVTLSRVLAENLILLFWLCIETSDEEEWQFRINALRVVDNRTRLKLTEDIEGNQEPESFLKHQSDLQGRLKKNSLFQNLGPKRQREILRGNKMPFIQDEMLESLMIEREIFRKLYRYYSQFVHTGPVSFFRAADHNRGHGEFNEYEATAILGAITFSNHIIMLAIEGFERLSSELDEVEQT